MTASGMLSIQKSSTIATYAELKRRVRETLLEGQRKIEQQKVLTYWETGNLIDQHIQENTPKGKERAKYNQRVVERLSQDLEISDTVLYRCVRFSQVFKKVATWPLSWGHYRALLGVEDEERRYALADQASKNRWPVRELEIRVRNERWANLVEASEEGAVPRLPLVCLGPFYTYRMIDPIASRSRAKEPLLDFGFSQKVELGLFTEERFPVGTIVTFPETNKGCIAPVLVTGPGPTRLGPSRKGTWPREIKGVGAGEDCLYTYKAYVDRVMDGDTLKVEFELGWGHWHSDTIRLSHIDCPEASTPEGQAAKRFVERELAACEFITIKSTQTRQEKWGRYLGEVFYAKNGEGAPIYLNQILLDKGHAVRVRH